MNPYRYLVFGFQSSGKTTFAAALWHLLDSKEVPTELVKGKHIGDFRYLEKIAQSWCEGWRVSRTQQVEEINVNLRHPGTETELALEFADLSGETFERAFATRLCTPTFVDLVGDAAGILLFVSANRKIDDVTILDVMAGAENSSEAVDEDQSEEAPWDPEKTPLQVQLVDLLQSLQLPPFTKKPFKVAVIISAWDLTNEESAADWLSQKMPLLDQYLKNKDGTVDVRVYGVSAQGGELSEKGKPAGPDRDRLLSIFPPSKRIRIVGLDVKEHDLTGPILWLSGLGIKN